MQYRITECIRTHPAEHYLSAARIARTHHISVRTGPTHRPSPHGRRFDTAGHCPGPPYILHYLHKLFESENATVGKWVQRRRPEEYRRDLARHAHSCTISAVAHRWGFTSAAHFSGVFRAVYGISPREWRDTKGSAPYTPSPRRLLDA
ncbi:helix-turn-helix transcriptional regulator [Streptomyces sp. NPDC097941]|uniref:helix-turn-helix transcriptional regulator n=1 Tax=Streptomyces sp. NPDC097941 TaxID=3155685 RepID=UPI0033240216